MVALWPSSLLHERLGEVLVADTNSGRPDGMAEERYTPPAEARNLGDEPTDVQALEKAGDARTLPVEEIGRYSVKPSTIPWINAMRQKSIVPTCPVASASLGSNSG